MKIKVLLLGSAGMAGHIISAMLKDNSDAFELIDVARNSKFVTPRFTIDVTNFDQVGRLINDILPDYVINCVGILNKEAENNADIAILVNSYLPHFLEKQTKNTKTRVIHISTDCVFSGDKGGYDENAIKDGRGIYAESKALGEIFNEKDLTIRTSIIGPELNKRGIGLFNWFQQQTGEIFGYSEAIWSGVTTVQLAKVIIEIMLNYYVTGLIHLTNNTRISKFDLLNILKSEFDRNDITIIESTEYKVDKSLLNTREDLNFIVPSYRIMILEMHEWIKSKNILYS